MEELETFRWRGEGGEVVTFDELTETEQRVALIAAGGLLRRRQRRTTEVNLPSPEAEPNA